MIRSSAGVDVTSLVGETVILDCPLVNTNSTTIVWMKNYKTVNMGRNVEVSTFVYSIANEKLVCYVVSNAT